MYKVYLTATYLLFYLFSQQNIGIGSQFFTMRLYYCAIYLIYININKLLKLTEKYQANIFFKFLQYNGIYIQVFPYFRYLEDL